MSQENNQYLIKDNIHCSPNEYTLWQSVCKQAEVHFKDLALFGAPILGNDLFLLWKKAIQWIIKWIIFIMSAFCREIMVVLTIQAGKETLFTVANSATLIRAHFNDLYKVHFVALFPLCAVTVSSTPPWYSHNRVKTDVSTLPNVCEMLAEEASYWHNWCRWMAGWV